MLISNSTLSNYFIWTVLRRLIPFLSRPFREAEAKYKRQTSHIKAEPARWLTCITTTNYYRGLTFAAGSLYIEKAFDRQMILLVCRKYARFLALHLNARFQNNRFDSVIWLRFNTRKWLGNLAKISVVCFVGYFGGWPYTKPDKIQKVVISARATTNQ